MDRDCPRGEASTNGLLDPHHICDVVVAPRVLDWPVRRAWPRDRSVLLKEALEGRATGLLPC